MTGDKKGKDSVLSGVGSSTDDGQKLSLTMMLLLKRVQAEFRK